MFICFKIHFSCVCHALWFFSSSFQFASTPKNFVQIPWSSQFSLELFSKNCVRMLDTLYIISLSLCYVCHLQCQNKMNLKKKHKPIWISHRILVNETNRFTWIGKFLMRKNFSPKFFVGGYFSGACAVVKIKLNGPTNFCWQFRIVVVHPFVNRIRLLPHCHPFTRTLTSLVYHFSRTQDDYEFGEQFHKIYIEFCGNNEGF